MVLVVGGAASGKRTYALSLGYADEDVADGVVDERPVVHHAERLLGGAGEADAETQAEESVVRLADVVASKEVVTISEVGAGPVPASADARAFREATGQLASALAQRATCVVRMTCGVPYAIKGELPSRDAACGQLDEGLADGDAEAPASTAGRFVCDTQLASTSHHEYPFFTNRTCPYFPCHDDLDPDEFNCLFCYCPLYALGPACGGRFTYTDSGVKNCTGCSIPHRGDAGTKLVREKWEQINRLAQRLTHSR